MPRADAPKPTIPIRDLTTCEYLILLLVGQHRKRKRPMMLAELEFDLKPWPMDESVDNLGDMGLLRNAQNDRDQDIRGSLFVDNRGWVQVFNQHKRVLRKGRQEAQAIRDKAETTRKPEDPTRRKDHAGAAAFEAQAKMIEDACNRIEELCKAILPTIPVAASIRATAEKDIGESSESQTQAGDDNEIIDVTSPDIAGEIQVDAAPSGSEGLSDMVSDVPRDGLPDEEEAPAPRRRPKK